jgi:hypothetical protein
MAGYDIKGLYQKMAKIVKGLNLPDEKKKTMFAELRAVVDQYKPSESGNLTVADLLGELEGDESGIIDSRTYPKGTKYAVVSISDVVSSRQE